MRHALCRVPGVTVKYDSFVPYLWHCVDMGYVDVNDAMFCATGLRWGFNLEAGLYRSLRVCKRIFNNYPPARKARNSVTEAMMKRVAKTQDVTAVRR